MALSDIYQVNLNQTLQSKLMENVFFFEKDDPAGTAQDVADYFVDQYLQPILGVQTFNVKCISVVALNLGDLSDFATFPTTSAGNAGDVDTLPAFNSVGYSLRPNTRAVRPGSKRFSGVPEAAQLNGVLVEPGYLDAVEDLRVILSTQISGSLAGYLPIVVKRIKEVKAGYTPPAYKYRLPGPGDPLVYGNVIQALANRNVTSQTSRKD